MSAPPGHRRPLRRRAVPAHDGPSRVPFERRLAAAIGLATLALLAGSSAGAAIGAPFGPRVILLSLDGVRPEDIRGAGLRSFEALRSGGAWAERLVPVFPANTFPNHATLATGAWPEGHGIVGNRFLDRERGLYDYGADPSWLEAEPLWAAAGRQAAPAAVFFWVASEGRWPGQARLHRYLAPFDSGVGEAEKVDRILSWLAEEGADAPRLILSWWRGVDRAAHRHGPGSPEARAAMQAQDAELYRLVQELEARGHFSDTTLVVVSDHGMARLGRAVDPGARLEEAGIRARVITGGGVAFVYLRRAPTRGAVPPHRGTASPEGATPGDARASDAEGELALARRAARALRELPGVRAWPTAELPPELHLRRPDRAGEVIAVAEPPLHFAPGGSGARLGRTLRPLAGGHGYLPDHPDMAGIFLARGRGVPVGLRLEAVRAVDVAPTVAALLCIAPPRDAAGEALAELVPDDCDRAAAVAPPPATVRAPLP